MYNVVQRNLFISIQDLERLGHRHSIDNAGGKDEVGLLGSGQTDLHFCRDFGGRFEVATDLIESPLEQVDIVELVKLDRKLDRGLELAHCLRAVLAYWRRRGAAW